MFKTSAIAVGLFSFLMLFSFVQSSDAELQDLLFIDLNVEQVVISSGDTVIVTGTIVDHAYEPVSDAEILIRTGTETITVFTDLSGMFRGEFTNFEKNSGTYTVNVIASWNEMKGMTSIQFQVEGDFSPVSVLQEQLNTADAKKYLNSQESDFEKDPIGLIMFKHYRVLASELILEQKAEAKRIAEQAFTKEQKQMADDERNQAIEDFGSKYGVYDGYTYQTYVDNLNLEIKDLIIAQLDFTKNKFEQAQQVRAEIIANGGTSDEARQAYLDALSFSKEKLEEFNDVESDESSNVSDDAQADENSEDQ